jgi:hypothetical protein
MGRVGSTPERDARARFEETAPLVEEARISPELVDRKGFDQRGVLFGEHREGAHQRGEHAPPFDVPHEEDRRLRLPGGPEIREVAA